MELWGKVQKYRQGYRAEFARPKTLYLTLNSGEHERWVNLAGERHDIPVVRDETVIRTLNECAEKEQKRQEESQRRMSAVVIKDPPDFLHYSTFKLLDDA